MVTRSPSPSGLGPAAIRSRDPMAVRGVSGRSVKRILHATGLACALSCSGGSTDSLEQQTEGLEESLRSVLQRAGFTGRIESSLEQRMGRRLDPQLVDLGRLLFFDPITGLHDDNTCA